MATILIIEGTPNDRKLLATTLRSGGHEVLEASDGDEALNALTHVSPHLVISDILMPTFDGYAFVRRMRAIPAVAATPVIFYTAAYHEHEARALARQCGVVDILMKRSAATTILATVDRAFASATWLPRTSIDGERFEREHLALATSTSPGRIDRIALMKEQMRDVAEGAQHIAAERDPGMLFTVLCIEARRVTLAQHAIAGLLAENGSAPQTLFTSGFETDIATRLERPCVGSSVLATVVTERRTVRTRNPDGRPETLGLPREHPRISSLLSVPIASKERVYGWLSLRNKLGADAFTDGDEHAAVTLGTHAGIAYEAQRVLDELRRRNAVLEGELAQRSCHEQVARRDERARISRTLHDGLGQALVAFKMDLHRLASKSLDRRAETDGKMQSLLEQVNEMIRSVRTLATDLRAAPSHKSGLLAAIASEAQAFERRSGIRCRVEMRVEQVEVQADHVTLGASIVREALTNVLRHARATRVTVSVQRAGARLIVSIGDNGRGIPAGAIGGGDSLGQIGMSERAVLLGGTLDVHARRVRGTVVSFTIPLSRGAEPRAQS